MSSSAAAVDEDVERRACYGVAVSCVSLVVFCVVAATSGVVKAGAATGFTLLFLGVIGWFLPFGGASTRGWPWQWQWRRRARATAARRRAAGAASAGCSCTRGVPPGYMPPAFKYDCAGDAESGKKYGGDGMCAVCLEDVRRGEAVRRMPACGHVFHKECVDMWLESHATCPLCRRELQPRACGAEKNVTVEAAAQSSAHVLPPV
ncbi:unnamed protein product [Urochloa decumbens]|uniref:RING-type E3 ubiquitin transferase n=1 Tax=Urochloa decumbens TaxID=240449 RepID=A0ABC9EIT8_9POAL